MAVEAQTVGAGIAASAGRAPGPAEPRGPRRGRPTARVPQPLPRVSHRPEASVRLAVRGPGEGSDRPGARLSRRRKKIPISVQFDLLLRTVLTAEF